MSDEKQLKVLKAENAKLKQLLAEKMLENQLARNAAKKGGVHQPDTSWCTG